MDKTVDTNCPASGSIDELQIRLRRLEILLVEGLSSEVSAHLDSYIHRLRQLRLEYFPPIYFSDHIWDILLELSEAHRQGKKKSVSKLGRRSGIPQSIIARCLNLLERDGYVVLETTGPIIGHISVELSEEGKLAINNLIGHFTKTVNQDLKNACLRSPLELAA